MKKTAPKPKPAAKPRPRPRSRELTVDERFDRLMPASAAWVLENFFAAALPHVIEEAHGIEIKPESILMRAQEGDHTQGFDFIAPNGELVLAGEVKTRLTGKDVKNFRRALESDFRALFPEYADLPVYGVVAGAGIDRDAAQLARRYGFYILRMEGSALHPDTGKTYRPKKY